MEKYKAKIIFEAEGNSEDEVIETILFALNEEINSDGKHIEVVETDDNDKTLEQ